MQLLNCALYCNVSDVLFRILIIFVNIVSSVNTSIVGRVVNCSVSVSIVIINLKIYVYILKILKKEKETIKSTLIAPYQPLSNSHVDPLWRCVC